MRPKIDTTKPIQVTCADRGRNSVDLWFDFCLVHMTDDFAYGYTTSTNEQMTDVWKFTEWKFRNKPEEPSESKDTQTEQPEIVWSGELQMRHPCTVFWEDVTIWCHPIDGYVWLKRENDKYPSTWALNESEFRNKPQASKRVQGWVNVYTTNIGHWWPTKEMADTKAEDGRIACVYIDVQEGHGLER